jgi:hypothetical protein
VRLGASLLDWTGWTAREQYGTRLARISAWTTNDGLHRYCMSQGFEFAGLQLADGYPSAARFEKATATIGRTWPRLVTAPQRLSEP